ncbi:MAG TPA: 3-hydroxyacyl-CoA dehydrogenase NAD-binding domain-containing protein [Bacteroidota bacterium]|nr:3-hydroxyacyl-CoA dehydrogenase NAD-binding domain-containing protein [Bacteroidota bacterium]
MPENLTFEDLGPSLTPQRRSDGAFQSVGVIGLGVMGQGIVETIANAGIEVIGVEKNEASLRNALDGLGRTIDTEIKRWSKTTSEKRAILSRVRGKTDLKELKECDIVIEAVDENFELKKRVLQEFYGVGKTDAVFISNTATLSLSKLAEASPHPDKIIGMHFLNPVPQVALVEIVRALKTSDQTYELVKAFASKIGKTPVEVFEYPGFITTRIILPMLNEAMHLLMEGNAKADAIDTAMRLGYGMQSGPLEMADTMGLDEVLMWMETIYHELGEPRFRPCPLLRRMVREGRLGKKTGEGFFRYNEDGKRL